LRAGSTVITYREKAVSITVTEIRAAFRYHHRAYSAHAGFATRAPAIAAMMAARADVARGTTRCANTSQLHVTIGASFNGGHRHVENFTEAFRGWQFADEAHPRLVEHKGWWADSFQDSTYRAAIFRLTGHDGRERFLSGYIGSDDDTGAVVDFSHVHPDTRAAALAADRIAEKAAEEAREYCAAYQSGVAWREALDEVAKSRNEFKVLVQTRRLVQNEKAREVLLAAARAQLRIRREAQAEMRRLAAGDGDKHGNFHFWAGDHYLREAFDQGAEQNVMARDRHNYPGAARS
jgi:hypothetical protein